MKKQIFHNFLKDKSSMLLLFCLNSFILIVFFNIAPGQKHEVLYPAVISFFFLIVLLLIEWLRYYNFNLKLLTTSTIDALPKTCEQRQFDHILKKNATQNLIELENQRLKYEDKNLFLSQWIHNFKTPISIIELLLEKLEHDERSEAELKEISKQCSRLTEGIDLVLNMNRLEKFEKDYVPQGVDLLSSLKKVINLRKSQFILSNLYPKIENESSEVLVLTDIKWNEFLIDQLVSNAIKYSQAADTSKSIYFSFEKEDDHTILSIRDEGMGIPPYDLKKVFEPFFTGENGRKVKSSSGIGLFISMEIARSLGHDLSICSEEGQGTTVRIRYLSK